MSGILKQLNMLQLIPRWPRKTSTLELLDKLTNRGFRTELRSIQRNLITLSSLFPIGSDENNPRGWYWEKDAKLIDLPTMDPQTALTFKMVEEYLIHTLPRSSIEYLKEHFSAADKVLNPFSESSLHSWPQKVKILHQGLPKLPPDIKPKILDMVYDSLLEEFRIQIQYKTRGSDKVKKYEANPLGLVFVGNMIYLVCTLWDYKDIIHLALHRMLKVSRAEKNFKPLKGFDLEKYVENEHFNYLVDPKPIRIGLLVDKNVVEHLEESPLGEDQKIISHSESKFKITATVPNTEQLHWWIRGYGSAIIVEKPKFLRQEFFEMAEQTLQAYQNKS